MCAASRTLHSYDKSEKVFSIGHIEAVRVYCKSLGESNFCGLRKYLEAVVQDVWFQLKRREAKFPLSYLIGQ